MTLIEEHETWIAAQEGRISGRQMHPDVSDVSDIVFGAHPYLTATETANSAMLEKGRSLTLA